MAFLAILLALLLASPAAVLAQGEIQPRWLIDSPTAGLLPRGSFSIDCRF